MEAAVGVAVTGPPGGSYDNALFEQERGHALVYLPTAAPPRTGRVHPANLPAAELAVTTHVGEHDGIEVTYGELGTWVVENAMSVAGSESVGRSLCCVTSPPCDLTAREGQAVDPPPGGAFRVRGC